MRYLLVRGSMMVSNYVSRHPMTSQSYCPGKHIIILATRGAGKLENTHLTEQEPSSSHTITRASERTQKRPAKPCKDAKEPTRMHVSINPVRGSANRTNKKPERAYQSDEIRPQGCDMSRIRPVPSLLSKELSLPRRVLTTIQSSLLS